MGLLHSRDWWYSPLTTSPKQSQRPRLRRSGRPRSSSAKAKWEMEETCESRMVWRLRREATYAIASSSSSDLLIAREVRRGQKRARLCNQSELTSVTERVRSSGRNMRAEPSCRPGGDKSPSCLHEADPRSKCAR